MSRGTELLRAWLELNKLKQYEAAQRLGITGAFLCQILKGHRRPGLMVSVRIQDKTGILPESWLATTAQPKKSRKAA